jgi:signal transduction histidine kinase
VRVTDAPRPPAGDRHPLVPPDVPARTRVGRWWLGARLRRKVAITLVLIVIAWLMPIAITLAVGGRLAEARHAERASAAELDELDVLHETVQRATSSMQDYMVQGLMDAQLIEDYEAAVAAIPDAAAALDDGLPAELGPERRELQDAIDALVASFDVIGDYGVAGTQPADVSDDPALYELNPGLVDALEANVGAMSSVDESFDDIEVRIEEMLTADRRETERRQQQLVWSVLATMGAALVIAAGGTYILTAGLVGRVEMLSENASRFIRGSRLQPSAASTDEIGDLTEKMLFAGELLETRRNDAVTATRAKDEFLARVSHELKTPLTAMIGFAQLLQDDPDLPPEGRDETSRIVDAGHQLHELIEELLDIKAIEAGKLAMTLEPVELPGVAADAITLVQSTVVARGVVVATDLPDGLLVSADRRRLREVLLNLLSNAIKYNGPDGRVELAAVAVGGRVRVSVTDTGPGISEADQERIFEPFERLDVASSGIEGTGVGLALTKHVVEAMGGAVGIDSEPGQGATFWIELASAGPAARPDQPAHAEPGATPAADTGTAADVAASPDQPVAAAAPAAGVADARRSRVRSVPRPPVVRARTRAGQWWLDAPLRRKLLVLVVLIALVSVPPIGVAVAVNGRLDDASGERQVTSRKIEEIHALQGSILGAVTPMQSYLVLGLGEAQLVEDYRAAAADIPSQLAALEDGLPAELTPAARELAASIDAVLVALDDLVAFGEARAADPVDPDNPSVFAVESGLLDVLTATLTTTSEVDESVAAFEQQVDARLADNRREVDRSQAVLLWSTIASMAAALLIMAGGTYLVTTSVVRRIERLSENASRFIRLEPMLPVRDSADEIGQLSDKMLFAGELLEERRNEAVSATRAKDEFLSRVSHELKVPLAAIIDLGRSLEANAALSPQSQGDAAMIVSAGLHLHELIDELLDIKAIEAGRLSVAIEPIAVERVADDAITLVRSMPASRSITIVAEYADDAVVAADRRRLREVLLNLLSNAVKYNCPGGRVELAAAVRGEHVRISVTDTGPGISAADQERLFEPFERLAAADTEVEGSGVGLALTKSVVEAMGGSIGVDSEPGRGSTFWFDLPAAGDDPAWVLTPPASARDGADGPRRPRA